MIGGLAGIDHANIQHFNAQGGKLIVYFGVITQKLLLETGKLCPIRRMPYGKEPDAGPAVIVCALQHV